ncbi:MAG: hypothetical protein Q8R40_00125 [bacterium]|nr:hypothetical protein [bacterium]
MGLKSHSKIILALFAIASIFWAILFFLAESSLVGDELLENLRRFTQVPLVFVPLIGGLLGLRNAFKWGGGRSVLGRAVLGISIGLLAWAGGMAVWNYYLFFTDIEIPYPSVADGLFILSWPLWTYGILQLSKATGARFGLHNKSGKGVLFLISGVATLASIYVLFGVARGWSISWDEGGLKLFFDLFYPIGDIVILTLVVLVYGFSRKFLGGIYKTPVTILFIGFLLNYTADFIFVYTTTVETYFNGHFVDFLYTVAMFALSFGLSMLDTDVSNLEENNAEQYKRI